MAWVSRKPSASGKYRAGYVIRPGERVTFMGTAKKGETLAAARAFETEAREIRLKLRAAPGPEEKHAQRAIGDVIQEYLDLGNSQGGRGGNPWSVTHSRKRRAHLSWWVRNLDLKIFGDLTDDGILGRAQKIIQTELQRAGRSGQTCSSYRESIVSFCAWAVKMGYMVANPLRNWAEYNKKPVTERRALTPAEIGALLAAAPEHRRMVYEVALATGLRAGELAALRVGNLDAKESGLNLEWRWTKNRLRGFQSLPRNLMERLVALSEGKRPTEPLLQTNTHPHRTFKIDCEKAGVALETFEGRTTFHALRHTAITLTGECGATPKQMQTFARHSDPRITMNTYAKVRREKQAELVEKMGNVIETAVQKAVLEKQRAESVHAETAVASATDHNAANPIGLSDDDKWWRRGESNPRPGTFPRERLHA